MKYQIRKERNTLDEAITMYNVYKDNAYQEGTASGYLAGRRTLEEAREVVRALLMPQSELIETWGNEG